MKLSLFLKFLHFAVKVANNYGVLQKIIRLLAKYKYYTIAGEVLYVCWRVTYAGEVLYVYRWQILSDFTYAGEVLYVCWRFTYADVFTYAGATYAGATPPPPSPGLQQIFHTQS